MIGETYGHFTLPEEERMGMSKTGQYDGNVTLAQPIATPPSAPTSDFVIKDSGKRETFAGGMVRDTTEGKTNYALVLDGPMFLRWAVHLTKGAVKYAKRNWMLAQGADEYERAKESAFRHFMQWYRGDRDEDHAAAVFFNINEAEYIRATNTEDK